MGDYAGQIVNGASSFDYLGGSLSGIGDFNGDGFDDFIVGARYASDFATERFYNGAAYLIFGTADGPATLNVNDLDGTNGFLITASGARGDGRRPIGDGVYLEGSYISGFGSIVGGVGDVNGDGFADVAVAGRTNSFFYYGADPLERPNAIFIVFGAATGFGDAFTVADLDGTNGFQVTGTGGVLNGIEAAGDVNGDGVDDFLISQSPVPLGGFFGEFPALSAVGVGEESAPVAFSVGPEEDERGAAGFVIFGAETIGAPGALDMGELDGENGFEIVVARSDFVGGYFGGYYGARPFESFTTALGDVGDVPMNVEIRSGRCCRIHG